MDQKKGMGKSSDAWLLTYSPGRWAGLSVILHTIKNKSKLLIPNSLSVLDILDKIEQATHISLTPSLFRKLQISDHKKLKKSQIQQITFGGEYATQKIINDARTIWPSAKITHIYASTELGDICSCSDYLEGYPTDKIKTKYFLKANGELVIGSHETNDIWEIKNNRLYFIGRMGESINIGGAKVTRTFIENNINGIFGVSECRAYPIDNALLGQVVGLDYSGDINLADLKKELIKILPKYAIPLKINKVESISITSANKINRLI